MTLNKNSWHLLEKTITTSSFEKTKRLFNSNYDFQDQKNNDQQLTKRLTAEPEEDIHSVHSYYKEEFRPIPSPRVPQPTSINTGLQINTKQPKLGGFTYLHPSLPPSPPQSSPKSFFSSPQHSPQGKDLFPPNTSLDGTTEFNPRNIYSPQDEVSQPAQDFCVSHSTSNLQPTAQQESNSPFISRAASYNSALGYSGNGPKGSHQRRQITEPLENHHKSSGLKPSHNINGNPKESLKDPKIKVRKQVPKKNKMQRSPSSADISTYDGCGEASKKLQMIANFIFLTSSLVLIGVGAGLLGFYRIHMLEVITVDFVIVPMILVVGGVTTLFAALFGFYVTMKEDSCLMVTYAVIIAFEFLLLVTGIVATVRLLFIIQTGLFDADVIPELTLYETDPWVRYKWDTMQREFTCCGGYGYATGYTDWKHTLLGGGYNSVPDSCCLMESPGCGANLFNVVDLRVTIQKIHLHGCLTIMMVRLETHVKIILGVFCAVGGTLAILELLTIVLACCYANQIAKMEKDEEWEYDPVHGHNGYAGGGYSNQHQFSRPPSPGSTLRRNTHDDVSSQHETAF